MNKLSIVGIGPGSGDYFTQKAIDALEEAEVIVGYGPYLKYIEKVVNLDGKELFTTPMMGEIERCIYAVEKAAAGTTTAIVSTGDAGLYAMAGPIFEIAKEKEVIGKIDFNVVAGVSAVFAAAAHIGAPLMHDTAIISLSDLLTPWEDIKKRAEAAASTDFVIAIYNPRSKKRSENIKEIFELIKKYRLLSTPVGLVRNAGRDDTKATITSVGEIDFEEIDMMSLVIVGNSKTKVLDGYMVTPRGYENK